MDKGSNEKKWLIAGLATLGTMALALVIALIIVFVNKNTSPGEDCAVMDDDARSACLEKAVSEGENEEAVDGVYDAALDRLLRDKNYTAFADVLFDRLDILAIDGNCDEALRRIDDSRLSQLPDTDLAYYYRMIMNIALECNDEAKYNELDEKYWTLEAKGGIEVLPLDEEDEKGEEGDEDEGGFEEESEEEV